MPQSLPFEGCGSALWPEQTGAEPSSSFAQVEQLLGEDCLPDAEFFVRCWTVGAPEAAGELQARRQIQKERERRSAGMWEFSTFIPPFRGEEFIQNQRDYASQAPAPATGAGDGLSSHAAVPSLAEEDGSGPDWESDLDTGYPFTLERARQLLGVGADSTPAQIKGAYRRLVRMYHPDRLGADRLGATNSQARQTATGRMMAINRAYSLLGRGRAELSSLSIFENCTE